MDVLRLRHVTSLHFTDVVCSKADTSVNARRRWHVANLLCVLPFSFARLLNSDITSCWQVTTAKVRKEAVAAAH